MGIFAGNGGYFHRENAKNRFWQDYQGFMTWGYQKYEISSGTNSQKVPDRILSGYNYSRIQFVFSGSEYMEGIGKMVGKGLESGEYYLLEDFLINR